MFTSIMPNEIGSSSNGSYCFAMARYISISATRTMIRLPIVRFEKAVW